MINIDKEIMQGVTKIKWNLRENWFDNSLAGDCVLKEGLKRNTKYFWSANYDVMNQIHMASQPSSEAFSAK